MRALTALTLKDMSIRINNFRSTSSFNPNRLLFCTLSAVKVRNLASWFLIIIGHFRNQQLQSSDAKSADERYFKVAMIWNDLRACEELTSAAGLFDKYFAIFCDCFIMEMKRSDSPKLQNCPYKRTDREKISQINGRSILSAIGVSAPYKLY